MLRDTRRCQKRSEDLHRRLCLRAAGMFFGSVHNIQTEVPPQSIITKFEPVGVQNKAIPC